MDEIIIFILLLQLFIISKFTCDNTIIFSKLTENLNTKLDIKEFHNIQDQTRKKFLYK